MLTRASFAFFQPCYSLAISHGIVQWMQLNIKSLTFEIFGYAQV